MQFNTTCYHAEWLDLEGQWKVQCRETRPDGTVREFVDYADILLNNCGVQNDWKWPDIEGLDLFKGKLLHTARWDPGYQTQQWEGQNVAVIGGGASSVQTVPGMQVSLTQWLFKKATTDLIQPHVKHMDVFVRTGVWFVGLGSEAGENTPCKLIRHGRYESTNTEHAGANDAVIDSVEDKKRFRDGKELVAHGKEIEHNLNGLFPAFYRQTEAQTKAQNNFRDRMARLIKDKRLLEGKNSGCKDIHLL